MQLKANLETLQGQEIPWTFQKVYWSKNRRKESWKKMRSKSWMQKLI